MATDSAARMYDPRVGRWMILDPLAIKFPAWYVYNYVMGNPIKLIDEDGKYPGEPEKTKKTDPAQITASYFGIRRTQIGGNVDTYLNTDFDYITPSSGQRFAPDEPSSFFELRYNFADNNDNINFSAGLFRNHTKGGFLLEGTETGKVHWGVGNSQFGFGGGFEASTPSVKGFKLSASGSIGAGPQFTRLQDANVTPSNWGIRGVGVVGIFDLSLKTPELGGIFSASLSVRGAVHHAHFNNFTITESGGKTNYSNLNFTTAGIMPTIQLIFNLSKSQ